MKIKRKINGSIVDVDLTESEMKAISAAWERRCDEKYVAEASAEDLRFVSLSGVEKAKAKTIVAQKMRAEINASAFNMEDAYEKAMEAYFGIEKQFDVDVEYVASKLMLDARYDCLSKSECVIATKAIAKLMRQKLNVASANLNTDDIADILFDICVEAIDEYFTDKE